MCLSIESKNVYNLSTSTPRHKSPTNLQLRTDLIGGIKILLQ